MLGLCSNMLGYGIIKHVITNEVARGLIYSDIRFNTLVDSVGQEKIKANHTRAVEVKNDLFD